MHRGEDIGVGISGASPLRLDSKAALDMAVDPVAFKKTKHILRHAYELRDRVARRIYTPEFVPTADQLADILTKSLRVAQHRELTSLLLHAPDAPTPKRE